MLSTSGVGTGAALAAGGAATLLAYSVFYSGSQVFAPVIRRLSDHRAVALTFDDGPSPVFTPLILEILAKHHAKASFCLIGRNVLRHPALAARIVAEGHTVANHSWDHDHHGIWRSRAYWTDQLEWTSRVMVDTTGKKPALFRAPMGFKTWPQSRAVRHAGLHYLAWRVRGWDTLNWSPETIVRMITSQLRGGDIVTLHDGLEPARQASSQERTVQALPRIIEAIHRRGWRCVALEGNLPLAVYG